MKKELPQLIKEGQQFKTYRKLMGLKQIDAAALLQTDQGELSRMEHGKASLGWRLEKMLKLFIKWRVKEIQRLHEHINYLNQLSN